MMHKILALALSIISPDRKVRINPLIISLKVESCDTLVISRIDFRHVRCKWKILGKVDAAGRQPKCSSWSGLIPSCKLRNLVVEMHQMTDLRCRKIIPAQTLVSQQVPCLWETEHGEKGHRNFHAVTWPSISRDAVQGAAQSNHQCQSKVRFHAVGQEKRCCA